MKKSGMRTMRACLKLWLGPTVDIAGYSDERVRQRFRSIKSFYGGGILRKWSWPN